MSLRFPGRSPEDGLDTQEQLADAERLDHVVVRAQLEPDHAVNLLPLGRQHHHGNRLGRRVALELPADVGPRDVGKHDVQADQVGAVLARQAQPLLAAQGLEHVVARPPEVVLQHRLQVALVLDDQNPRHGPDSCRTAVTNA